MWRRMSYPVFAVGPQGTGPSDPAGDRNDGNKKVHIDKVLLEFGNNFWWYKIWKNFKQGSWDFGKKIKRVWEYSRRRLQLRQVLVGQTPPSTSMLTPSSRERST